MNKNKSLGPKINIVLALELHGHHFQAPDCLTQTLTDGNILCSLIYTSISGTLSCQNHTGNTQKVTKLV